MDSDSPANLASPAPASRFRRVAPAYLVSRLISSYIGYLLVMGVLVLLVPQFDSAFADKNFKLQRPAPTEFLFRVSAACIRYYLWAFLLPLPALWAVANFNIADKTRRRRLRLGAFIFVAAFLIFTLVVLFLPMTRLPQESQRAAPATQR